VKSKILFLFKHSYLRETALQNGGASSFLLYGYPELADQGLAVETVSSGEAEGVRVVVAGVFRRLSLLLNGYSGNFSQVFASWERIRSAKCIVLTSNNVAIPVLFLKWLRIPLPPVLAISVGLETLRKDHWNLRRSILSRMYRRAEKIIVFSAAEKTFLVERLRLNAQKVVAVPYGIPQSYLPKPTWPSDREKDWDIISVGADIQRDLPLLINWATQNPTRSLHLVLSEDLARSLADLPDNISVETNLSLEEVFERLIRSRFAVIPVHQNHYTAGTTFLIHSLSTGTPTLVARTQAVETLYNLESSGCMTYIPNSAEDFSTKIDELFGLAAENLESMAREGRNWVEEVANGSPLIKEIKNFAQGTAS